ncbi:MAG: ATP-dependent DNA helicase [Lachnospiraceae bacterium]|nr:ATP-dependent DNA helicase [Lachnospiraceae bacterium]
MKKVSVRKLVEFILRSGDIDGGRGAAMDVKAMEKGTMVHRRLQDEGGAAYASEMPLKCVFRTEAGTEIQVDGRADGIITETKEADGGETVCTYVIDEIKGTYRDVRRMENAAGVHLAQAYCYAYMWTKDKGISDIGIQITYINLDDFNIKRFHEERTAAELDEWFAKLMEEYSRWIMMQEEWENVRNASAAEVEFPYEYRKGQRKFVAAVYHVIKEKKRLFAQAPTGTGKTIAVLFPAVKTMGEGLTEKIFYLTAKNLTGTVARQTLRDLSEEGLHIKYITITAKDKICFLEEPQCDPESCPYAKGHFDRVNEALYELVTEKRGIDRETVRETAEKHNVCPFELQLDAAEWMDVVICDYNYLFDPNVSLKRFFSDTKKDHVFLVDEAHNLVDRGRSIFSRSVTKQQFLDLKKELKDKDHDAVKTLDRINREFLKLKSDGGIKMIGGPGELYVLFLRLLARLDEFLKTDISKELRKQILDVYFSALNFMYACDLMDDRYIMFTKPLGGNDHLVKIMCIDPSGDISRRLDSGRSTVFFSATLLPIDYYRNLLSSKPEQDLSMYVDSPFDEDKRFIAVSSDVSSRYTRRNESEYRKIAAYIKDITSVRRGNYLVFFPSYAFMESVADIYRNEFCTEEDQEELIVQRSDMTEGEKDEFLSRFRNDAASCSVGFCVLGGVFSEGIDLRHDSLIGAVIVGTGIPQISDETDLIKDWFEKNGLNGFDYAYRFPGMTKVLQAGGRVIRTKDDVGIIALLDERFNGPEYSGLFPREWSRRKRVNASDISDVLKGFWGDAPGE